MNDISDAAAFDYDVRRLIYEELIERATMPGAAQIADGIGHTLDDVRASLARLKEGHILVLQEGDQEVLMANPFSAVPTPFIVKIGEMSWWGNCIWDAMGIAAMVGGDALITTGCGDCNDAMELRIEGGSVMGGGIVHFSVPARKWWDNIKFT